MIWCKPRNRWPSISIRHRRAGNLTDLTDPNGNTTAYTYDKIGRILSETSAAGGTNRFAYELIWTGKSAGVLWNKAKPAVREFIADERGSLTLFGKGKGNGANSAFKADLLKKDLKYTERYGSDARVELPDGRIRYYGELEAAKKPGEMVGRRVVQELDSKTGNVRIWHETLDASGNIRQVRPQLGPDKTHYRFDEDGNYIGKW